MMISASGCFGLDPLQRLESVDPRHRQIEDDQVVLLPLDAGQRILTTGRGGHFQAPALQPLGQGLEEILLIIHQQHLGLQFFRHLFSFLLV